MASSARTAELHNRLTDRFNMVTRQVLLGGRSIDLLSPEAADELIDEDEFERDERLPYWADLWPSSRVLAEEVLLMRLRGLNVIELGCGLGLVSLAAAMVGAHVTATDYYEDALLFTRLNVELNSDKPITTRMIDWTALPADLKKSDVVLASDVLYEPRYADLVADVITRTLVRGGQAVVADPGRIAISAFIEACRERGLTERVRVIPFGSGKEKQKISLWTLEWA